jgi:hypothetical protein
MELESLRRGRRILSAAVMLAAVALVMAKVSGGARDSSQNVGTFASLAFVVSVVLLVLVWRKEHSANEAAFAARAEAQLAFMRVQLELAKKKELEGKRSRGETPEKLPESPGRREHRKGVS